MVNYPPFELYRPDHRYPKNGFMEIGSGGTPEKELVVLRQGITDPNNLEVVVGWRWMTKTFCFNNLISAHNFAIQLCDSPLVLE